MLEFVSHSQESKPYRHTTYLNPVRNKEANKTLESALELLLIGNTDI